MQLQLPMKIQSLLPGQYKRIQTQPHQSWSSKQDGDLSVLYIFRFFPTHMHAQTEHLETNFFMGPSKPMGIHIHVCM